MSSNDLEKQEVRSENNWDDMIKKEALEATTSTLDGDELYTIDKACCNGEQQSKVDQTKTTITIGRIMGLMIFFAGVTIGIVFLVRFLVTKDRDIQEKDSMTTLLQTEISLDELAIHNNENDCWVSLHGDVYDLTEEFATLHPGGTNGGTTEFILELAGTDGTEQYDSFHSSTSMLTQIAKYQVGTLETAEATSSSGDDETEARYAKYGTGSSSSSSSSDSGD